MPQTALQPQQAGTHAVPAWSAWWLQAKQLNQDTPDDLYVGSGHPARNVVPLSARLPGSARKLPATTAQQQQQMLSSKLQESSGPGIDLPGSLRLVANNIVAKPQVPQLNMGRHESSFSSDQAATARAPGGPGSLPHVSQHRGANTSRPAYAATSQQYAGTTTERPAPSAVETGPITPAQALKRYGEYLTAFEQSEVLQYSQVSGWMVLAAACTSAHNDQESAINGTLADGTLAGSDAVDPCMVLSTICCCGVSIGQSAAKGVACGVFRVANTARPGAWV